MKKSYFQWGFLQNFGLRQQYTIIHNNTQQYNNNKQL